ncbi:MAG: gamma carbonic anhydrase family protein [Clostridia bacterium]|nr:gamma carbonic anhydrase family protein [Clostridia bacterium]
MIKSFSGKTPVIDESAFIAENATVIGDVTIGKGSSVWYSAVLRGDMCSIKIGKNSNIQDNATIHVGIKDSAIIGDGVTVGHNALVHGATVEDNALIGMGSVVLDGAVIGKNSIVAAGAVVTSGTVVPPNSLVAGVPATVVKELSATKVMGNKMNAMAYTTLASKYKKEAE